MHIAIVMPLPAISHQRHLVLGLSICLFIHVSMYICVCVCDCVLKSVNMIRYKLLVRISPDLQLR